MTTKKVKMQAPKKTKKKEDDFFMVIPMSDWQDKVLRFVAYLIGFRATGKIYVITINKESLK